MQSLFLPDIIDIDFIDKTGRQLKQANILVGIHTFASRKNNIKLWPFLSDQEGHITIRKEDLENRANIFVSYGLMDYSSLETAKPDIQFYFWGTDSIDLYINHWTTVLKNKNDKQQYEQWGDMMGKFAKQDAEIEIREREDLHKFETCFNRFSKVKKDIILAKDLWNQHSRERHYRIKLAT